MSEAQPQPSYGATTTPSAVPGPPVAPPQSADAVRPLIAPLSADVIGPLRSSALLSSAAHVVQELVANALDAGATVVDVDVDLAGHRLAVSDNGTPTP